MQDHNMHHGIEHAGTDSFPTDPSGLPRAAAPRLVELGDGDELELVVEPVAKQLGDTAVRMLAYNRSVPGPTLKVRQDSQIAVHVVNNGDLDTTLHWHGLRLENRYDGVPYGTQAPVPVGGRFSYRVHFPDPGLYWYHPHVREDYAQELGLYGNILVVPADPDYWPPVDSEIVLTLDDILLEDGAVAPFSRTETTHAAMGRYGNVLLVGGETNLELTSHVGEVVRLWLTNTANTRVFNVTLPGARMKLVGGDSGRIEHEEFVDEVLLAPSERAVVDVLFDHPGQYRLEHRTPQRVSTLAAVTVDSGHGVSVAAKQFDHLRRAPELEAERAQLQPWLQAPPDRVLALIATIAHQEKTGAGLTRYACPMHPDVVSDHPGHCPKCGMKLLAAPAESEAAPTSHSMPSHDAGSGGAQHGSHPHEGPAGSAGIEWEDEMAEVNRRMTAATIHWQIVDRTSGTDEPPTGWRFTVGDRVKIRLVNEAVSDHPMHHPFHIHGAGRFLVLARDGSPSPNLVWKDTILVRAGQTVDLLLEVTHPGLWMAHCHIPEHMHSGMMFNFTVTTGT